MKTVFISNYFNHHQCPFSDAMQKYTEGNYTFVSTGEMPEMRRNLGYKETTRDYVKKIGDAQKEIDEAEIIIGSSFSKEMLEAARKGEKILFRCTERFFKMTSSPLLRLPRFIRQHRAFPENAGIYLLCASAYTSADAASLGLCRNRAYKWGYFPEAKNHNIQELISKKDKTEILWCGRFISWKHPDDALAAAEKLKNDGIPFTLKFVGAGETEDELRLFTKEKGLENNVVFLGNMHPEEVRTEMEKASVFITTSDFQEGWGAVLNEAMNSGCAVVASHAAGSTPFLVKDGENGFIYKSGDVNSLYEKIKKLLLSPELSEEFGEKAYKTIAEKWNADIAAQRLITLSETLISGKPPELYSDGPCSKAEILKNNWYK